MNLDTILTNAENLFIKYGATVSVHYMRIQRERAECIVVQCVLERYISDHCSML